MGQAVTTLNEALPNKRQVEELCSKDFGALEDNLDIYL